MLPSNSRYQNLSNRNTANILNQDNFEFDSSEVGSFSQFNFEEFTGASLKNNFGVQAAADQPSEESKEVIDNLDRLLEGSKITRREFWALEFLC